MNFKKIRNSKRMTIVTILMLMLLLAQNMTAIVFAQDNAVWAEFDRRYRYRLTGESFDGQTQTAIVGYKGVEAGVVNEDDETNAPLIGLSLDAYNELEVQSMQMNYLTRMEPPEYAWNFDNVGENVWVNAWFWFTEDQTIEFEPNIITSRSVNQTHFDEPGGQRITIRAQALENVEELAISVAVPGGWVSAAIKSVEPMDERVTITDDKQNVWIAIRPPDTSIEYEYTIIARVNPDPSAPWVDCMPSVVVGIWSLEAGTTISNMLSREDEGVVWTWTATDTYTWHWEDRHWRELEYEGYCRTNEVESDVLSSYDFETQGDTVPNKPLPMIRRSGASMYNRIDGTGLAMENPTLTFTPKQPLSVSSWSTGYLDGARTWITDDSATTFVWAFDDLQEDVGNGGNLEFYESAMLSPGFDFTRSVIPAKFSSPGTHTQTLTVTATPSEDMAELGFEAHTWEDGTINARIIAPTSSNENGINIWHPDERNIWILVSNPTIGHTYTFDITIEIELFINPAPLEVEFRPSVGAHAGFLPVYDTFTGNSFTLNLPYGDWTWGSDDECLWHRGNRSEKRLWLAGYATYTLPSAPSQGEIDAAIANGLAWLALQQNEDGSWNYGPTSTGGSQPYSSTAITAMAVLAFEQQGHLPTGDPVADPFVENVRDGLDYILSQGHIEPISQGYACPYGNPDANGDGFGISFESQNGMYDAGAAIAAIVGSLSPNRVATTAPVGFVGRTYREIVREAVEYCAWAQNDYEPGRGGWRYGANDQEWSWWEEFDYNEFTDGYPMWDVVSGTWKVEWEKEAPWNRIYSVAPDSDAISVAAKEEWKAWTDYSVKVALKIYSGDSAGLLFRVQGDKFYWFGFTVIDGTHALALAKHDGDVVTTPSWIPFEPSAGKWYRLHVDIYGNNIVAYLWDDSTQELLGRLEYTDDVDPFMSGSVGLDASSTMAYFDRVDVSNVLTYWSRSDNSVTKWQPVGLYAAEVFWEISAPQFIKQELDQWLTRTQRYDGSFGYEAPPPPMGPNVLRAGGGISSLIYAGAKPDDPRVKATLAYLERNWIRGLEIGGSYDGDDNFGNIQAMYAVAKGCTMAGVKSIGGHDWYSEYAAWVLSHREGDHWPAGVWGNDIAETVWALLILGKKVATYPPISEFADLRSTADGDSWVEVSEAAEWQVTITVRNDLTYDMKAAIVTDKFGSGLGLQVLEAPATSKVVIRGTTIQDVKWTIGNLKPGEKSRLVLRVFTLKDKAGRVGYKVSGAYKLDSGAKLEYTNDAKAKFSALASPMPIAVWLFNARIRCPDYFRRDAYYVKQDLENLFIGCDVTIDNGIDKMRIDWP